MLYVTVVVFVTVVPSRGLIIGLAVMSTLAGDAAATPVITTSITTVSAKAVITFAFATFYFSPPKQLFTFCERKLYKRKILPSLSAVPFPSLIT